MIKFILVVAVYHTLGGNAVVEHTEILDDKAACITAGKDYVVQAKAKYADADYTCYRRKVR
ncbi:hypothetical protein EDF57_103525 [Novosphingobium sp. PhB55]|uniref:hypothetical protein n=1 Tax=Novosphingobium sp. PhB55 TaxID=2485106 RepID=UPI00106715FE|nr:hypothetical protein [Novosphingobium sp. PhB55]TDW65341.1 hypothetical protein EDF57_103525 [Novosphingobium sp. PhB55]